MEEAEIPMLLEPLSIWLLKLQNSNELNLLIPAYPYLCTTIALCNLYLYTPFILNKYLMTA